MLRRQAPGQSRAVTPLGFGRQGREQALGRRRILVADATRKVTGKILIVP